MKTIWLLIAQYEGKPVIPVELICRDYFTHLSADKFVRKCSEGAIDLPLLRLEESGRTAKGVALVDFAAYLDARAAEARRENDLLHGRRPATR